MTESDPRRIRLLREALDLPTAEREDYLVRACADDAALLESLRRLLAVDAATALPLDHPAELRAAELLAGEEEAASQLRADARVGPYQLVRELGRGGMGSVWLARRVDGQFQQQVALKLIRLGMDSVHILRQFRRERALLARLQHPNIAQLIDGGVDEHGRPWFAMECIDGVSLTDWVQGQRPGLVERLQLFTKLCRAVAHAHRQLIVHRDLKPSNVLVQSDGEPRLLDFGIARLLEPGDPERTATVQRFLTQDFAAPELLRGESAGTSADVFALGLILFELLTGLRYRAVHADHDITLRPSAALTAHAHTGADAITRTQLRGDLDAIATRALADDPARRYADAQQLADDVQRYLDGRPIEARPDRISYRAAKFVHRNRAAVAVGAPGLATLLAASTIAAWQAVQKGAEAERARLALRQAEATRDFVASILLEADPSKAKGVDTTAGELLAAAHTRIGAELADEPALAAELLALIGNTYVSLDQSDLAQQSLREALAANERAARPSLTIAASAGGRLAYYAYIGGDATTALARLDELVARVARSVTTEVGLFAQLAKLQELRGSVLYGLGRKDDSLQAGEAAVAAWRQVRTRNPYEYLWAEIGLADLQAALGRGADALERADRVLDDPLLHGSEVPPSLQVNAQGVRARALQALDRHAEAEPLVRATLAGTAELAGFDNPRTRYWRFRHAETLHALGRLDDAQALTDALLALPAGDEASYRRIRTEVLAARIARDRGASDATSRIGHVQASACSEAGNEELCQAARALAIDAVGSAPVARDEQQD